MGSDAAWQHLACRAGRTQTDAPPHAPPAAVKTGLTPLHGCACVEMGGREGGGGGRVSLSVCARGVVCASAYAGERSDPEAALQ